MNYLTLVVTLAGLLAGRLWTRGGRRAVSRNLVKGVLVLGAAALPWWIAFPPFAFAAESAGAGLADLPRRVAWLFSDFNRYLLPLPAVVILLAVLGRDLLRQAWFRRMGVTFLLAVPLSALPLWTGLITVIGFRYVVNLLPVAALLFAAVLRPLLGPAGIILTLIVLMQFGNPSSGGSNGVPYLPSFWHDLGPILPPRNAFILLRNTVYFDGNGIDQALTVLLVYAVVTGVILGFLDWFRSPELSVPGVDQRTATETAAVAAPVGPLP